MPFHHHQHHQVHSHHTQNNHHHHQQQQQQFSCCYASNNNSSSCSCCCNCSLPPSPPPPDQQLLQALTNQLLSKNLHTTTQHHYLKPHHPSQHQPSHHHPKDEEQQQILQSLLRRVTAIESSLSNLTSSPKPSPPQSLRDIAARTIQSHFRKFLLRRSQTLRHLKHLASIKSHAAILRSSLTSSSIPPPQVLSQKALDLLLQLDSIQSGDPMIREGKRSVTRELVRISEFVDKVLVKEEEQQLAKDGGGGVVLSRRRVSFAENGNEGRDFEEDSEETGDDSRAPPPQGMFCQFSDGGFGELQNGNRGLSAPLPVQMESRKYGFQRDG